MKIKTILLSLILVMAGFVGLSVFLQDRLSRGLVEQATKTQEALIKTGALVDNVRQLQINFKWQIQAFKDVLLRGKDAALFAKYKEEYEANLGKVTAEIGEISRQMQSAEYAPVAEVVKRLAEDHKAVTAQYSAAIEMYSKLTSENPKESGLAADVTVRGIDRQLTADIDKIAQFARERNEANAKAASEVAAKMQGEMSSQLYLVAAVLAVILVLAGAYASRSVMSVLGAEPVELRHVAEKISSGDLTATIDAHDADNESSLASQILLMQMKMRSLVIGIREEAKGALDRAREGAGTEEVVNDLRALSKSMRKFKTSAAEESA
jgi:methyl-accepting chemotaxis protein